jgi:hypothetical protein
MLSLGLPSLTQTLSVTLQCSGVPAPSLQDPTQLAGAVA